MKKIKTKLNELEFELSEKILESKSQIYKKRINLIYTILTKIAEKYPGISTLIVDELEELHKLDLTEKGLDESFQNLI